MMLRSGSTAEPDYAMALAKIQHMNRDELNELLNNESPLKLEEYVKNLDQVILSLPLSHLTEKLIDFIRLDKKFV